MYPIDDYTYDPASKTFPLSIAVERSLLVTILPKNHTNQEFLIVPNKIEPKLLTGSFQLYLSIPPSQTARAKDPTVS